MKNKKLAIEYITRLMIVSVVILGTVYSKTDRSMDYYICFLLLFLLNSQIRIHFLKEKLFLISLFVEIGIILLIVSYFETMNYLLLYIPMLDFLTRLQGEKTFMSLITLGCFIYILKNKPIEVLLLNIMIYIFLIYFADQVRKLRKKIEEVEYLYDENRKYSDQLEGTKNRLETYMRKVEELSQTQERNRISREIHDTIGHQLTGLLMQSEAAVRMLEIDYEKGKELVISLRDNMKECVGILSQTVRNMRRESDGNIIQSIQRLINDFSSATGIKIDFEVYGRSYKIHPNQEIALYRNVQEAITNSARHGNVSHINIKVLLEYLQHQVVLTVKDDGKGCKQVKKGMGISGIEERVSLLGGTVEISNDDGFQIKTIIPIGVPIGGMGS